MSRPVVESKYGHTAFVPDGDSRRDTAIVLVGTARSGGLDDDRAVVAVRGGFYISDELADLLYDEDSETQQDPETEPPKSTKKASGNRAAKNSTAEQE